MKLIIKKKFMLCIFMIKDVKTNVLLCYNCIVVV